MKTITLGKTGLNVPQLAVGCMRIANQSYREIEFLIRTAMDNGANFFDHADIYAQGESERKFAAAVNMNSTLREKMFIQSKCAIVPGKMYDFSCEHIISSVEGSLKRLHTDYLDVLLLHRPDALCEPQEVAKAFQKLKDGGKVRHFGVSNHNPLQIELLNEYLDEPLCANQLRFGPAHCEMIANGINVNMKTESATMRDGSVLDFCRLKNITIQPWSPLRFSEKEKKIIFTAEECKPLADKLNEIGKAHSVSGEAMVISWIIRHPAKMMPIVGTTNPKRLLEYIDGVNVEISREEWYEIYLAAGNNLP